MRIPFRLVDVFADRPLSGNQLCVVSDPMGINTVTMQALAGEIGFSETTFVTSSAASRYSMRIFTPTIELPFAGHPTLGTAFVLASEGRIGSTATQEVTAGEFKVTVDLQAGTASVRQLEPTFGAEVKDLRTVAEAAGISARDLHPNLPPQVVGAGLAYLIVPVASVTAVTQAVRDDRVLPRILNAAEAEGLYLFAETEAGVKARMFDADLGIGEDPATGSAAGPLGAYLADRGALGMPGSLAISQGEELGRPSTLHVSVAGEGSGWAITVSGGVHIVGDGAFAL